MENSRLVLLTGGPQRQYTLFRNGQILNDSNSITYSIQVKTFKTEMETWLAELRERENGSSVSMNLHLKKAEQL